MADNTGRTEAREQRDPKDKSLPELLGDLSHELSTLVREEIALAKAELSQKIRDAGQGAGLLSGAAVAALMGLGSLTAFAIIALGLATPLWLSALIVTGVWFVVAAILALTGRSKVQEAAPPVPEQTVETLREDVEWAKHPTKPEER